MTDRRQVAVDHLSSLLERDLLAIDDYHALVDRVLAATTDAEVGLVLAKLPAKPPMVLRCASGVIKEKPLHVPAAIEIVCESGVMKVDLSIATFDEPTVDLDIECDTGVLVVVMPRDVVVEIGEQSGAGGVFTSRLQRAEHRPGAPRLVVHVRNGGGVIKLRHRRFGWRRRH